MQRDPETVHRTMASIKGKDTGLEMALRKRLHQMGIRYFANSKRAYGHPDLLFLGARVAVFCDSEFWHGYHFEEAIAKVKTNVSFWEKKIRRNMARDREVNEELAKQGYLVLRYWGEQILEDPDAVAQQIATTVRHREDLLARAKAITKKTTLAYIEQGDSYLLLYRNKKKNDENEGKWIGVGGHLEPGETRTQAMKREIKEETGLDVETYRYCGAIDFLNGNQTSERMYLYKVTSFSGELSPCDEGTLAWVKKSQLYDLPMWEGDRFFLPFLEEVSAGPIRLLVYYAETGELKESIGPIYLRKKADRK